MRVALLYPPPWKIPAEGEAPDPRDGPPEEYRPGDLDADFYQTPYGLFALGAAAMRAGHPVKVLNLSAFAWPRVDEVVHDLDADVFGLSCWTANRRGVALVAAAIKRHHPRALVVVGGPHATPLAKELLERYPAIDLVCSGESDVTFLEILDRLGAVVGPSSDASAGGDAKDVAVPEAVAARTRARAEALRAIPGTVYRDAAGGVLHGPKRASIEKLDELASPHDYFATHILMTSRGCPWQCTFCGADTTWGRGFRGNSVEYVLDAMEKAIARLPVKMIQIKDDTFTTNKKRVVELCRGIRARGLDFFWSCDTRVDLLSEELLREMRLAGCQRLSLGVESGSQKILDAIDKKITPDEIIESTQLAKAVGIKVRYYMMLGNRGETRETFEETLRFLERAKPNEYIFSCLSIYPGTRDFYDAEKAGWLDRKVFLDGTFQELKTPFDADEATTAHLNEWFFAHHGLQTMHVPDVAECEAVLAKLGDYHAAHMDLGAALYHAGDLDRAQHHIERARELGYPLPGLVLNHLACIAKARGDLDAMMERFSEAAKVDPQHYVLIQNVQAARMWFKQGGPGRGLPLELQVRHDFQLLERTQQPTLPGPLPEDLAVWGAPPVPAPPAAAFVKTPEHEGSTSQLKTKLRVVPS